jgi:hypothetical protein
MAKYDSQLTELKNLLPTAKNILIALPAGSNIDKLAAGLSLFLTLEAQGKQVSIVCEDNILVGQAHLFGVDHIQKTLPSTEGGNLTLTLEGVAASDNTVPALEKLDWYAERSNLNLVFHVLPGQTFQPAKIVPRYQGSGFNLIFAVGAVNLNALGNIYSVNPQAFSGTHTVNIDTQVANTSFGQTNVLDSQASSLSEVMANVLTDLGLVLDADTASNLLAGIFEATGSLTNEKVNAETYLAVANCLRAGGKKPSAQAGTVSQTVPAQSAVPAPAYDWTALLPNEAPSIVASPTLQSVPGYPVPPIVPSASVQQIDQGDHEQTSAAVQSGSPEERPAGEGVVSETVEPEWLTPKIFKGSSLG